MAITVRQFWIQSPGSGEIVTTEIPARQEEEVLVRAVCSGISRGTETLVFKGEVPESQQEAMRAPFQEGAFPAPVKYGYMNVGEVLEGPDSDSSLVGRTVFCLYPHQDYFCVPAESVIPVPEGVPVTRAVLAANMETAVNAAWDGGVAVGDRIVVVGGGVVGLLIGWLCRQVPGTDVTVTDVNDARAAACAHLGLGFRSDPPDTADADLVYHASGHAEGLVSALAAAGLESTVVEVSWHGTSPVRLFLGEDFHSRRLSLKSSQVGRIPPHRRPRWDRRRRLALAMDLLQDPVLDALISGRSDFEELPTVLEELSDGNLDALCHVIRYPAP